MKYRQTGSCTILAVSLLTFSAWSAPGDVSISPYQIELIPGGPSVAVTISGQQVTTIKSVQFVAGPNRSAIRGLSATLGTATNNSVKIQANAASLLRNGRYRVELLADGNPLGPMEIIVASAYRSAAVRQAVPNITGRDDNRIFVPPRRSAGTARIATRMDRLPTTVFEATRRASDLPRIAPTISTIQQQQFCPQQQGTFPPPQVTSVSPTPSALVGQKIRFAGPAGPNLLPNQFCARLGSQYLKVTSRTNNLIEAELPEQRMAGLLYVSHGTTSSEYVLEQNYTVFGPPAVTNVSPNSFIRGDIVTVLGTDLGGIYEFKTAPVSAPRAVKISSSSSNSGSGFMKASEWTMNSEGTEIVFRAGPIMQGSVNNLPLQTAAPQPQQLSGKLRFASIEAGIPTTSQYVVEGPTVTWEPDDTLSITALLPPTWGDAIPNFMILDSSSTYNNLLRIEGTSLYGAEAAMGDVDLAESISSHGRNGILLVPPVATTDYISLSKSGQNVSSTDPLILITPQFVQLPPEQIKVGQQVSLMGWDLQPANAQGLVFEFKLSGLPSVPCKLELSIDEHTQYSIKFTVVLNGTLPNTCLQSTLFGAGTASLVAQFAATFNGVERILWQGPYKLVP